MRYVYIFTYLFIYLFIGLSRFTVQSMIVDGVNLLTMPGMQRVVYVKPSKVLCVYLVYCIDVIRWYLLSQVDVLSSKNQLLL